MWIRCENKVLLPHDMSDIGWCQTWYRSTPGYSKSGLKWNNKIIIITSAVLDEVYWPVIGKFLQILRPHWSKRTQLLYSDINVTPVAVDRYNTLPKNIEFLILVREVDCGYFRLNNAASTWTSVTSKFWLGHFMLCWFVSLCSEVVVHCKDL